MGPKLLIDRLSLEPTKVKHISGVPAYGRLLVVSTTIRPGRKGLLETKWSSLLRAFINYVHKSFIMLPPGLCFGAPDRNEDCE